MTADRGQVQVWAKAYVEGWLARDDWLMDRIAVAVDGSGASRRQIAEEFSLAAAALLVDACGGDLAGARRVAAGRLAEDVAAQARMITGRVAGSGDAGTPPAPG